MRSPPLGSLRVQIGAAFLALVAAFSAASLYALAAFQRQIDYDSVVDIGARLQLTAQRMHLQAMNYEQNAPPDYPAYSRDLKLYYRDLMAQISLLDQVVDGFMRGDLSGVVRRGPGLGAAADGGADATPPMPMPRVAPWLRPGADDAPRAAIAELEQVWADYRAGLMDAIGADEQAPRLQAAAAHILAENASLEHASRALTDALRRSAAADRRRIGVLAAILIGTTLLTALVMLGVLHYRALKPLQHTIAGFQRVTDGDFGHVTPEEGAAEVRDLIAAFNALSARLNLLFLLIDRLQRGNDLDEVVGFLGLELRELLRFDWIGVVLVSADQARVRLEASALDGIPEPAQPRLFRLSGTLLERALAGGEPMHIEDMRATASANPGYELLRDLVRRGLNDAVFLPVASQTPIPAVVVFATRAPSQYDTAHMRFLNNIAQLISESFGRTVRLVERGRLATVGELASAIAHELRTPLATMSLALDYFARQQQPPNARKRLELAGGEAARMGRLLDDMLLYAKPLSLTLAPLSPSALAADAVELAAGQACCGARRIELRADPEATRCTVLGDRDRLLQVLINLLRNACEAAPPDSAVTVTLGRGVGDPAGGPVLIDIHNTGEPIPEPILRRAFQPFVSAKRGGTGLGLAIVHRLVQAHGGEVTLSSSEAAGTHARVTLPSPPEVAAERGRETGGEGPTQPDPAPAGARGP